MLRLGAPLLQFMQTDGRNSGKVFHFEDEFC
jgi:hypothetical protein